MPEGHRLLIVSERIRNPPDPDPCHGALRGKLCILRHGLGVPTAQAVHQSLAHCKSGAYQLGRQPQVSPGTVVQQVEVLKIQIVAAGNPGVVRVHGRLFPLSGLGSCTESVIHPSQEIRVHQVVCIKYAVSIVPCLLQSRKCAV